MITKLLFGMFKGITSRICRLLFVKATLNVGPSFPVHAILVVPCPYDLATGCYVFSAPHTLRAVMGWGLHTTAQKLPRNVPNSAK